ncbi:MAG: RNA methyltransferase [Bacteroidales bacterium]|nr:RNA methyltransferase [Bacteroidales bacterium]
MSSNANYRKLQTEELHRISVEEYKQSEKHPIVVVLDNIRSASNVGSAFRTGDSLRIEAVYLCGISCVPPNKELQKTALGAQLSVPWKYFKETTEAIAELRSEGYEIVSVEQAENSTLLQEFRMEKGKKYAFVFGNEVHGVADEVIAQSDVCLEIPQYGTKHSFNVSVTCGIVLWEAARQLLFSN